MPLHAITPCIPSAPLGRAFGAPVWLKLESLQPTGSFKIRGIGRACEEAKAGGATRLVSSSGGNAGLAVAWAGRELGMPVTVFVPRTTSARMIGKMQAEGAHVEVSGDAWDDAHEAAMRATRGTESAGSSEARERTQSPEGAFYVHPFDAPAVWAGNATLTVECSDQLPRRPGAVVVSVGGGGLLCGVLQGMHAVGWRDVPVVAVETHGAASLRAAIDAGHPVDIGRIDSIATTLGARRVCDRVVAWTREHPVTSWLVSDREAVDACLRFADDHRIVVEPACGAALAVAYGRAEPIASASSLLVVVCGGAGATPADLVRWDGALAR
jgi:L-serine/L-threonine ammonia-lyase